MFLWCFIEQFNQYTNIKMLVPVYQEPVERNLAVLAVLVEVL
jgi:hypothetical protein